MPLLTFTFFVQRKGFGFFGSIQRQKSVKRRALHALQNPRFCIRQVPATAGLYRTQFVKRVSDGAKRIGRSSRPLSGRLLRLFAAIMPPAPNMATTRPEVSYKIRPTRGGAETELLTTMFVVVIGLALVVASFRFAFVFMLKSIATVKFVLILLCEGGRGERERISR